MQWIRCHTAASSLAPQLLSSSAPNPSAPICAVPHRSPSLLAASSREPELPSSPPLRSSATTSRSFLQRPGDPKQVILRYFDNRGRAQALRYALVDTAIDFKDERVPLRHVSNGTWFQIKNNPSVAGPFGRLPILHWGSFQLSQTEAIASYLYHKLGHDRDGDYSKAALSASLASLAHQDVIVPCVQLVSMAAHFSYSVDRSNLFTSVRELHVRIQAIISQLELLLDRRRTRYFISNEPRMGDYFVYEAVDVATTVFGFGILDSRPRLAAFVDRMQERDLLGAYLVRERRPGLLGSESEEEVMMMLQNICCKMAKHN